MSPPPRYAYVSVDVASENVDEAASWLWRLGATGLEERDGDTLSEPAASPGRVRLLAHFETDDGAQIAAAALGALGDAHVFHLKTDAWRDEWRKYFHAIRLGRRLLVRPSWEPTPTDSAVTEVVLDPAHAFGSGSHETTRLVLRELDRRIRPTDRVLDVGCGSGILSIAALRLGATRATAIDVDPDAIDVTRENAECNGVAELLGASTAPLANVQGTFTMVVANIEARTLKGMAPALCARLAARGRLVLSGILASEYDQVCRAFALPPPIVTRDGEWVALTWRNGP